MFKLVKCERWHVQCCASGSLPSNLDWYSNNDPAGYWTSRRSFDSKAEAEAAASECHQNYEPREGWPAWMHTNIVRDDYQEFRLYASEQGHAAVRASELVYFKGPWEPSQSIIGKCKWRFPIKSNVEDGWYYYGNYNKEPLQLLEFLRSLYPPGEQWIVPVPE